MTRLIGCLIPGPVAVLNEGVIGVVECVAVHVLGGFPRLRSKGAVSAFWESDCQCRLSVSE